MMTSITLVDNSTVHLHLLLKPSCPVPIYPSAGISSSLYVVRSGYEQDVGRVALDVYAFLMH
jgi:hypothetical protein